MKNDNNNFFIPKSNIKKNKKTYIISKLPDNSPLRTELKSSFEDVDKYLKVDRKIIIGNQQFQSPRRAENFGIVPWSIVGPVSIYDEAELVKLRRSTFQSSRISNSTLSTMRKEEKPKNAAFELIDDNKLKMIFQQYEELKCSNKYNDDYMDVLPEEVGHKLKNQEKSLLTNILEEKKFENMAKYLSKRTKKDENELLINKFHKIGEKKQIFANSEKYIPLDQRYAAHAWELSLRRPNNFRGTRYSYINLGDNVSPIWQLIKESVPDPVEVTAKPSPGKEENKTNKNENSLKLLKEVNLNNKYLNKSLELIGNLKQIELKGKDLLQQEIESSKYLAGKKILYKRDFVDTPYAEGFHNEKANNHNSDPSKLIKLSTIPKIFFENYNVSPFNRTKRIKQQGGIV